jgi:hypothetical protein
MYSASAPKAGPGEWGVRRKRALLASEDAPKRQDMRGYTKE